MLRKIVAQMFARWKCHEFKGISNVAQTRRHRCATDHEDDLPESLNQSCSNTCASENAKNPSKSPMLRKLVVQVSPMLINHSCADL
jgi:hypothetical protein